MASELVVRQQNQLSTEPYNLVVHIQLSRSLRDLGYPDLAAGYAYKALLLIDEILDDSGEYHQEALGAAKLSLASSEHELVDGIADLILHDAASKELGDTADDRIVSIVIAHWREIA